jgi:hypothetical protein
MSEKEVPLTLTKLRNDPEQMENLKTMNGLLLAPQAQDKPHMVYPELSTEQKLAIRDLQIELQVAREQGEAAIKNVTQQANDAIKAAEQKVMDAVRAMFAQFGLTTGQLDLRTLKLHD